MERVWPWLVWGAAAALGGALLMSAYQHARFMDHLLRVMAAPWL